MKKIYPLCFQFFFLLTSLPAQQEDTGFKGNLLDENSEPVGYANVTLFQSGDSSMVKAGYTLEDGSFLFSSIAPGQYYLLLSFVGYEPYQTQTLTAIQETLTDLGNIKLTPQVLALGEILVASTKPIIEVKPDKMVFNVEGSINATGNNALELLQKAPGVLVDNNERLMLIGKSGVRVYIDGRQSVLTGDDLSTYLKSLQASQIEAIEIITQPSSRYEAEGNAGIINIRLIKDKSQGTNAQLSLGHNQSTNGRTNANVNFNSRKNKLNFYGNANYATGIRSDYTYFERTVPDLYANQNKTGNDEWDNISFRAGLDYATSKFTTFGVLIDAYDNDGLSSSTIESILYPEPGAPAYALLEGENTMDNLRKNYNLNGNYKFDNKSGTLLNIDVDYGNFESHGNSYQPNRYYDATTGELTDMNAFSAFTSTTIDIKTLKVDYETPLIGGTLGAGFKLGMVNTDNIYEFYDEIDSNLVLNTDLTNSFAYEENVNAGYVNYTKQWEKFGLQLGARVEQTNAEGILTSLTPENGKTVSQDYLDVFPSGGITYQLNQTNTFGFSFSRRIDRPNYQDLNPFEYKLDELTYRKGNPFLQPQYTNSYRISHTYKYTLNTAVSYSHTTDLMAPVTDTASNGAAFLTTENIADQKVLALTLSYPFAISKVWNVFVNTGVTNKHNTGDFGEGKTVDISATTFNIYAQNTYSLPKNLTLELSGWYNSPGIWGGNFATTSMWSMDAGVQKKLWDGRGSIKVSVSDIFKTQEWSGESQLGGLEMIANGGWDSRQLRINLTYALGNKEVKGSRKRSTGLEDEASRISE